MGIYTRRESFLIVYLVQPFLEYHMHSLSKDVKLESLSAHTEHWEPVLDVACFAALCPSQTFWVRR